MRIRHSRLRGWSLIELTIILIVLAILCAILAPVIGNFVRHAKIIRCREDVQAIGCSIWMFITDTGNSYFLQDGSPNTSLGAGRGDSLSAAGGAPSQHAANRVNLLVGDGDRPEVGPNGDATWALPVNYSTVDFMEYHLCTNSPGNNAANDYRTPLDLDKGAGQSNDPMFARRESGGFNSEFSWRGPYMTPPIDPDPWGNRYACNVVFLDPCADSSNSDIATQGVGGYTYDVVVISAGPDEEIDSDYDQDGLTPGDDDMLYTVAGGSN